MCDVKLMSDDGESAVRSMNEDVPSNNDIQITQTCLIVNECKSMSTSTSEYKYYQLLATLIEETKVEESKRFEEIKVKVNKKFEEIKVKESKKFEETKVDENKRFEETTSNGFIGKKPINAEVTSPLCNLNSFDLSYKCRRNRRNRHVLRRRLTWRRSRRWENCRRSRPSRKEENECSL